MPPRRSPRFLVMGCGAIGGIVTAALAETARDVTAVTTNEGIYAAAKGRGLEVAGDGAPRCVNARVLLDVPPRETFDYVILATQPPHVEQAARSALPALTDDGVMVCLQNGLCESRVAAIAGERVIGAIVGWGATTLGPGVYERTAAGGFTLGYPNGAPVGPERDELIRALEAVGPVETTSNLNGKRWSKLAINCCISSLGTIGGVRLGSLLRRRFVRRLGLEIMTEVVHVAHQEGVRLERVSGTLDLSWVALTEQERRQAGSPSLLAKHALLFAAGFRFRRMKSSMLCAIERGRAPAVDFLNGEVVERARRHGASVPVNVAVREAVWAIARGKEQPAMGLLGRLYESTGPHGGSVGAPRRDRSM